MTDDRQQECEERSTDAVELVIRARPRDLGGFSVRRVLPAVRRRLVGPFIFFDHMGPATFAPGEGVNVRPHPHIALATITYLFEGAIFHRDSVGSAQAIRPGDVNWMIAGKGIVHSERTPPVESAAGHRLHGFQTWVALRKEEEEREPAFLHHPASSLPVVKQQGVELRIVSGHAYGQSAPTPTLTPTLYVDARIAAGSVVDLPVEHEQRALYVADGTIECEGETFGEGTMVVFRPGARVRVRGGLDAKSMILGGAPIDGERFIWWNFVASSKERIERAKLDWREGRFAKVPGDEVEFIPLPES